MAKKALLSLDTFEAQSLAVEVDGKNYALIGKRDVGFRTWAHITRLNARVQAINTADETSVDEGYSTVEDAVDEMVSIILPGLPKAKRDALNPWQKLAICEAFSDAVNPMPKTAVTTPVETPLN